MEIKVSRHFNKSFKKYVQTAAAKKLYMLAIQLLANNQTLPAEFKDHQLQHQEKGIRDFHLSDDNAVIYYRRLGTSIELIDVGSHNKLFSSKKQFKPSK